MARERLRRDLPLDRWWTLRVAAWYALLFSIFAYCSSTIVLAETERSVEAIDRDFASFWLGHARGLFHPVMAGVMAFYFLAFFLIFGIWVAGWRRDLLRRDHRCVRCCYPLMQQADRCHECGASEMLRSR